MLPLCLYGIARTACECEVGENRIVKKESETSSWFFHTFLHDGLET